MSSKSTEISTKMATTSNNLLIDFLVSPTPLEATSPTPTTEASQRRKGEVRTALKIVQISHNSRSPHHSIITGFRLSFGHHHLHPKQSIYSFIEKLESKDPEKTALEKGLEKTKKTAKEIGSKISEGTKKAGSAISRGFNNLFGSKEEKESKKDRKERKPEKSPRPKKEKKSVKDMNDAELALAAGRFAYENRETAAKAAKFVKDNPEMVEKAANAAKATQPKRSKRRRERFNNLFGN